MSLRIFIALNPNPELIPAFRRKLATLSPGIQGLKWVKPENLHFTLAFLGEIEEERLAAVNQGMGRAAAQGSPFHLALGATGVFPQKGNPQVIWVGLSQGEAELMHLQQAVAQELQAEGFVLEERSFVPHLTLARTGLRAGIKLPPAWQGQSDFSDCAWQAEALSVMRSELTPGGPVYHLLTSCPFGT